MSNLIIPNGSIAVIAEYRKQFIPEYGENPLIEALPQIYSQEEVVEKLSLYPRYNPEERFLESHYRIHMVQRLFQCFQPLSIHLDLESRISRVIRQGYLARNPLKSSYAESFQKGYKAIQSLKWEISNNEVFRTTAAGFTIIGVSGMGKTTAINRVLSLFPQIIVHSQYKNIKFSMYQLVWLKIDCPFDGSLKGLCIEFFHKVDDLLGTDYYQKFGGGRKTVDNMLSIMSQIARNTGLGVLIIDEIQHLNGAKSGGDEKMLNFFVTLVNTIGVPVILIGTLKALSILQSEFRQARRGSGQGDMIWEKLNKDKSWDLLLHALWDYQWTKKQALLTPEINDVIYEESQGIIDIAVKLYAMTQIRAILSGREDITSDLVTQVGKDNFKLVRPMLEALKSGNVNQIAKYEDICTFDIDFLGFIDKSRQTLDLDIREKMLHRQQVDKEKKVNISTKEQAILKLLDLDIGPEQAQIAVEQVSKNNERLGSSEIVVKAIQWISTQKTKRTNKTKPRKMDENNITVIVEEGRKKNQSAYETLKEKGLIKDVEHDIFQVV